MTDTRTFTDVLHPPEINTIKEPMRALIKQHLDQGHKGRYISLALLEVMVEAAFTDSSAWSRKFFRILKDMGEADMTTNRYLTGWNGPGSLQSNEQH